MISTKGKNPLASAGFEIANLGSRGEHVTPRPNVYYPQKLLTNGGRGDQWSNLSPVRHLHGRLLFNNRGVEPLNFLIQ